jgi:hypothetical protein
MALPGVARAVNGVAADLAMLKMPTLPLSAGVGATVVAIAGAAYFTQWYPEHY